MTNSKQTTKQGYKQTDIGIIPEDWEVRSLGKISKVEGGFAFNSKNYLKSGLFQIVKMSNLYGGYLDLSRSESFLDLITESENLYLLKKDDILITLTGTTGKTDFGYTFKVGKEKNLLLNQRVARIQSSNIDSSFLYYQTKCRHFQIQFFENTKGGTGNQTNVGTKDVEQIQIPLPKLPEQIAIATALSDIDSLITSLTDLIAKKKQIKIGTMQKLLKPQEDWEVRRLGEIADIYTGKRNNQDKSETGKYPFFVRSQNIEKINSYSFDGEAILIPGEGNIGKIFHYINGKFDFHQRVYMISKFKDRYFGKYIYRYISEYFGKHAMENSVKATVDSLRLPTFQVFEIPFPPTYLEQIQIATILTDMDDEITALETKLAKYRLIKQGAMQELLTGRIRLV